jgi:isoleucyl-tRNA synthetase
VIRGLNLELYLQAWRANGRTSGKRSSERDEINPSFSKAQGVFRYQSSMTAAAKQAVKSWSSTLRLPNSTFPARPWAEDIATYLQRCTDDLYLWQRRERPAANEFTLHDGPPYANGSLHIGHALNKILKDIICRTQLARGKRVSYVPGWDCHGLPIELKALNHHGWKKGGDHDPVAVRQAARSFADSAILEQMESFKSWGVMGDWENHWKTMNTDFELRQLSVFKELARKGLIYRRHKPVYWSPSSGTALAEAELEYRDDHISTAALVKFPLLRNPFSPQEKVLSAVIWTTTPWTIPANQALAVRKDLDYVVVRSPAHGNLLLAASRLDFVRELMKEDLREVRLTLSGSSILEAQAKYRSLFNIHDSDRPVFHADFVKSDAGTGLVHCAPGHGMEDYEALKPFIQAKQVAVLAPVDAMGRFTADAIPQDPSLLEGRDVLREGNQAVIDLMREQQSLITSYNYVHTTPYDWRTKEPIIVRATAQWFADVSNIRDDAIASLENVNFYPPGGKARLTSFVQNRSEWCISRQRAWGVPIPALYRVDNREAVLTPESVDHITRVIEERGTDAWWSDPPHEPTWITPTLLAGSKVEDFKRGTDTMDVWFDSGTSWSQLPGGIPSNGQPLADVYLEGTDQHRGWFQSSLLTRIAFQKSTEDQAAPAAPFRSLITHGFTLDERGRKMSKSEGNVIAPEEIIQGPALPASAGRPLRKRDRRELGAGSLGPDALRLWVASSDFTKDVVVSEMVIRTVHSALHKYRVTLKLLLGALDDFNPTGSVPYGQLGQMDQIALHQLAQVKQSVMAAYEEHEFHKAVNAINKWINTDLSALYIEAIKDSLYCDEVESLGRRAVQTTLYHILTELQAMLAPFTPLLMEESWEHTPSTIKEVDTHPLRRSWTPTPSEWNNDKIEQVLPLLLAANTAVKAAQEKARIVRQMGSSLESFVILLLPSVEGYDHVVAAWRSAVMQQMLVVSALRVETSPARELKYLLDHPRKGSVDGRWEYSTTIDLPDGSKGCAIVRKPASAKCERCWRYRADGPHFDHDLSRLNKRSLEKLKRSATKSQRGKEEALDSASDMSWRLGGQLCVRCSVVVDSLEGDA